MIAASHKIYLMKISSKRTEELNTSQQRKGTAGSGIVYLKDRTSPAALLWVIGSVHFPLISINPQLCIIDFVLPIFECVMYLGHGYRPQIVSLQLIWSKALNNQMMIQVCTMSILHNLWCKYHFHSYFLLSSYCQVWCLWELYSLDEEKDNFPFQLG